MTICRRLSSQTGGMWLMLSRRERMCARSLPGLEPEQENGGHCCERSGALYRHDCESPDRLSRQPLDDEEGDDGELGRHEKLPDVGSGPFIRLAGNPEQGDVHSDREEGRAGHDRWQNGAGAFHELFHRQLLTEAFEPTTNRI